MRVNGHSISLIENGVDPIQNGQAYVFFLKVVTRGDIYQAFSQSILDAVGIELGRADCRWRVPVGSSRRYSENRS